MSTKINILLLSLCFLAGAGCNPSEVDPEPVEKAKAFPQAEGGGAYTTGGRSGVIYYVTSLNDDINEAGTLRYVISFSKYLGVLTSKVHWKSNEAM